jgi:hypothetical protein
MELFWRRRVFGLEAKAEGGGGGRREEGIPSMRIRRRPLVSKAKAKAKKRETTRAIRRSSCSSLFLFIVLFAVPLPTRHPYPHFLLLVALCAFLPKLIVLPRRSFFVTSNNLFFSFCLWVAFVVRFATSVFPKPDT